MTQSQLFDAMEETPLELLTELKDGTQPEQQTDLIADAMKHTTGSTSQQPLPLPPPPPPGSSNQRQTINAGNLITEDLAVKLLNKVLPVLIVYGFEKMYKRKIDKSVFQATPDEEKTLRPVLHAYLNSINFNVDNPANALIIVCGVIYGTKVIEVANGLPVKQQPVKQAEFKHDGERVERRGRPRKKQ